MDRGGGVTCGSCDTEDAHYEPDADAPDSDYEGEGFDYLADVYRNGAPSYRVTTSREHFDAWRRSHGWSWVIRFEIVEIFNHGDRLPQEG